MFLVVLYDKYEEIQVTEFHDSVNVKIAGKMYVYQSIGNEIRRIT